MKTLHLTFLKCTLAVTCLGLLTNAAHAQPQQETVVMTFVNKTGQPAVLEQVDPNNRNTKIKVADVASGKSYSVSARKGDRGILMQMSGSNALVARFANNYSETAHLISAVSRIPGEHLLTFENKLQVAANVYYYPQVTAQGNNSNFNNKQLMTVLQPGGKIFYSAPAGQFWSISSVQNAPAKGFFVTKAETVTLGGAQNNPTNPPVNPPQQQATIETTLLNLVNQYRRNLQRQPVSWSNSIATMCTQHSADMANRYNGALQNDHNGANGRFQAMVQADNTIMAFSENVYSQTIGNLTDAQLAQAAFNAWKNSPNHNMNMLAPNMTAMGFGVSRKNGTIYFTQMFANPRIQTTQ